MHRFFQDLRFELRLLLANPGFAISVVLILALAIGVNTAVFTVTSALLLRPLPYAAPNQLILLDVQHKQDNESDGFSLNRYEMVRDHARSFSGVAAGASDTANLTGVGEPAQVPIARVSWNMFSVLGILPHLGRSFTESESRPEGATSLLITDSFWHTKFGADPHVVGRTVNLDSVPYTIIGVLPQGIQYPFLGAADVFIPRYFEHSLIPAARLRMGVGYLTVVARVKPDVTLEQARSEMEVLDQQYQRQNPKAPDAGPTLAVTVKDLSGSIVSGIRKALLLLSAAVALVWIIACGNIASLLLSRALTRRKEVAIRAALGAQRTALLRQLLTQGLLLSLSAGAIGFFLAVALTRGFVQMAGEQLPSGAPISTDWRVLLFSLALSAFTGVAFSLVPGWQLSRTNLSSALVDESRGGSAGHERMRLHNALVIGQVALCLVLLIGAGLLVRSFAHLVKVDPGFDPDHLLTMDLSLPTVKYAKPEQQTAFFEELQRQVAQVPGVNAVAISTALPLVPKRITPVLPEGQPEVPLAERPFIIVEAISPDWLRTMRVPLLGGRAFSDADNTDSPKVVLVNEAFARLYWPNENPVGKHVAVGRQAPSEVVGVTGNVLNSGLAVDPKPQLYLPFAQLPWADANLLIRTGVAPLSIMPEVKRRVAAIDSEQPVTKVRTGDELLAAGRNQPRLLMSLVGDFSILAFVLAILGVYGVLSYAVAQRKRELGIRVALGADRLDLVRLVVRHGVLLTGFGIGVGLVASLLLTRLLRSMLFQVGSLDVTTFVTATLVFAGIALLACYLPARRAATVDPLEILR